MEIFTKVMLVQRSEFLDVCGCVRGSHTHGVSGEASLLSMAPWHPMNTYMIELGSGEFGDHVEPMAFLLNSTNHSWKIEHIIMLGGGHSIGRVTAMGLLYNNEWHSLGFRKEHCVIKRRWFVRTVVAVFLMLWLIDVQYMINTTIFLDLCN